MVLPIKKMPTPLGIGDGQNATLNLPIGPTYDRLFIEGEVDGTPVAANDWGSALETIKLKVDGRTTFEMEAAHLQALNAYYKQPFLTGVLNLHFVRPWMRTMGGEDKAAYKTGGLNSFNLEMKIKAGVNFTKLEVSAEQSTPAAWGTHLEVLKNTVNQGNAGSRELSSFNKGDHALYALHFATGDIEAIEVKANNNTTHEYSKPLRNMRDRINGRSPQTGFTHVDFISANRDFHAMPMNLQDFRVRADFTAAGNFTYYTEALQGA